MPKHLYPVMNAITLSALCCNYTVAATSWCISFGIYDDVYKQTMHSYSHTATALCKQQPQKEVITAG